MRTTVLLLGGVGLWTLFQTTLFRLSRLSLMDNSGLGDQPWKVRYEKRESDRKEDEDEKSRSESPVPRRRSISRWHKSSPTLSACLLIMDENPRLIEWLVYHYFSINLRKVVIAVDPSSTHSPIPVLDRWNKIMDFEVWHDEDYLEGNFHRLASDSPKQMVKKHRHRQNAFFTKCIRRLRDLNKTWTTFIDPDEYITINTNYSGYAIRNMISQPGSVAQTFADANDVVAKNPAHPLRFHFHKKCVVLPRIWYTGIQTNTTTKNNALDTMRYRHISTDGHVKKLGKSIIDVSAISDLELQSKGNAHRPLFEVCTSNPFVRYNESPLVINHYVGTWEQYQYRNDSRNNVERDYAKWQSYQTIIGRNDDICPWLEGFISQVGGNEAHRLLQGAGVML